MAVDTFKMGYASHRDWLSASEHCACDLGTVPAGDGLGFLYVTDALEASLGSILKYLRQKTRVEHWVGTVGNGICATGREAYDAPAMAVMVADLPTEAFRVLPTSMHGVVEVLAESRAWRKRTGSYFGIVHGDPRNPATPELIKRLADGLQGGFLVGGLTSSQGEYRQIADQATAGGLSGVLFAGNVKVATGLSQGCSLIGAKHIVTDCQRNIIITLDGRPALEVFKEEIGELLARNLVRVAGYIYAALPISGSDTGDYLVRNLVGIDAENKLLAIGERVNPGDTIQFARRDAQTAQDDLLRMLRGLKGRAGRASIRGAVYHSCLGRGRHLFGPDSEELKLIRHELGDIPLVGFYANGEISHNRLYGYTGVLTLFLEP